MQPNYNLDEKKLKISSGKYMTYSDEELKDLVRAGKIAHLALEKTCKKVKEGVKISSLYDYAVNIITQTGAKLAFPPNISINEIAAHDSAAIDEKRQIPNNAIVKIDLGANVNEMLSDTAKTVSVGGKHTILIRAAEEALQNAINIIEPDIRVSTIGRVIQRSITSHGYRPIANLTGHLIDKGNLHAGISIPNIEKPGMGGGRARIKAGMILAIEPFATIGKAGTVKDSSLDALIYSVSSKPSSKEGKLIYKQYKKIPFSLRDANKYLISQNMETKDLAAILNNDKFHRYKPLVETTKGIVTQAEHTVYVTKKGAKILT